MADIHSRKAIPSRGLRHVDAWLSDTYTGILYIHIHPVVDVNEYVGRLQHHRAHYHTVVTWNRALGRIRDRAGNALDEI